MKISHFIILFLIISFSGFAQKKKTSKKTKAPIESVDPKLFSGLEYRSIGPTRGGRATAVAGVTQKPFEFYMGATGGGIWKTTDAGTS